MNAATNPGLGELDSTRPPSRAERRAEAARIKAEQQAAATGPTASQTEQEDTTMTKQTSAPAAVTLQTRKKPAKRPFSTQLKPSTLERLDWINRRGYIITDTVDDAINAYLDAAGIPQPDKNDRMPD